MKKFVALLLALVLAAACAVTAMADYDTIGSMKKWVDVDLEGYKIVQLFNYNECVALRAYGKSAIESMQQVNPEVGRNIIISGKASPNDPRAVISSTFVAGFEANEVVGNGSQLNVVPVDLTVEENTVFVYPLATKSHVVIGLLFAKVNVEEGFVQIEYQYKDELYKDWGTELTVYTTKSQLLDGTGAAFDFAEPISIEEELGGAPAVLVELAGKVTYVTLFNIYGLKAQGGFAYQDYYRYEAWAKSYRTNMAAALALVAD